MSLAPSIPPTPFLAPLSPHFQAPLAPKIDIKSHTPRATILTAQLVRSEITQQNYDAQIYATSILSPDTSTSVPIILTLDDDLAMLLAYANIAFSVPPAYVEETRFIRQMDAEDVQRYRHRGRVRNEYGDVESAETEDDFDIHERKRACGTVAHGVRRGGRQNLSEHEE